MTTMTTDFTIPANAKASADHLARKLKGYPSGFGNWPLIDRNAHFAAAVAAMSLEKKAVVTKPTKVKPANINRTPTSDMGNGEPPQMDARPYELPTEMPGGTPVAPPSGKFKLERWQDITFDGKEEWLIKRILPRCGVAAIYGKPGSFKSFVAMHIALSIALERQWAGRRVYGESVVYIGAEGAAGLRKRKAGYVQAWDDLPANVNFSLISAAPNLGTETGDLPALIAAIDAAHTIKPSLIVIDTAAKAIGSADENGAGMAAFGGNCEELAKYFGCLVLAVHHVGYGENAQQRMRGHSSFHGGVDAQILCERPEGASYVTTLTLQKLKDDASDIRLEARLERVVVDYDEDGEEVSTLIISEVVNADPAAAKKPTVTVTRAQRLMTDIILQAIDAARETIKPFADGQDVRATDNDRVRELYYEAIAEPADAEEDPAKVAARKRQAFNRAIKAQLNAKTLVAREIDGRRMLWLP